MNYDDGSQEHDQTLTILEELVKAMEQVQGMRGRTLRQYPGVQLALSKAREHIDDQASLPF